MTDSSDEIVETSDRDIDACSNALRDQACGLVCDRVPESAPECLELGGYDPPMNPTTSEP